ncbi:hypothetical protein [Cellulomonas sp. P5_E12]
MTDPGPRPGQRVDLLVLGAIALAGTALLLLWRGHPAPLDRLWAEDGTAFLGVAVQGAFLRDLLLPSAGYAHVAARLAAEVVATFPPRSWAVLSATISAGVRVAVAVLTWFAVREHIPGRLWRYGLVVAVIVLPVGGLETLDNLANLHWFLVYAGVLSALWAPTTRGGQMVRCGTMALAILSDPLAMVLVPLVLLRAVQRRRVEEYVATAVVAVACAIQLSVVLVSSRVSFPGTSPAGYARGYVARVMFGSLSGVDLAAAVYPVSAVVVIVVIVGLALVLRGILVRGPQRLLTAVCAGISVALWVAMLRYVPLASLPDAVPGERLVVDLNSRYTLVCGLFYVTAVIAGMSAPVAAGVRRTIVRSASVALAAWFAVGVVTAVGDDYESSVPGWASAVGAAHQLCAADGFGVVEIPIEPDGWVMPVPCSRLTGG